ncbi:MAG TPA: choice-of-anchor tandem repeat GloVer-containing protein [Bryobacteraceae bacterium]|nr:choice-of-anchor tandem repeat GloVer-containing protein [Bryobacteraceae bacterium]
MFLSKIVSSSVLTGLFMVFAAQGQTLNTLHAFSKNELGYQPLTGVLVGSNGAVYGTTLFGGASNIGVLYGLVPPTSPGGAWTESVLHSFSKQVGDAQPSGPPLFGPDGALYGLTYESVYQLKPSGGSGKRVETVLKVFTGLNGDAQNATGALVFGSDHSLLGTACAGGPAPYPNGIVFRLSPPAAPGATWTETVLYAFSGYLGDGICPQGGLVIARDGTLYGVTKYGGLYAGTAFQLSPPAAPGEPWGESILYEFGSQPGDAGLPNGVVLGPNGVLYGTTMGNTNSRYCSNGCGSVFQLSPPTAPGGAWTETILHTFTGDPGNDGTTPTSPPVLGPGGVLYGTANAGGGSVGPDGGTGTIWELIPPSSPGEPWTYTTLYVFTGGLTGAFPNAVTFGPDGNLYGTTTFGGGVSGNQVHNQGTVFQFVLPPAPVR